MSMDLPWYLKHSQVRRYTGDLETFKDAKREDSNGSENLTYRTLEYPNQNTENEIKGKRLKRKITALDYGYEDDNVEFIPFSGSLQELIQLETKTFQTQTFTTIHQSWNKQIFGGHQNLQIFCLFLIPSNCIFLFVWYTRKLQKQRKVSCQPPINQKHASKKKRRKKKKKLCTSIDICRPTADIVVDKNDPSSGDLQLNGNKARDMTDIFSEDVPRMAEIISRSGLSRQDSIRIAAQEVFAIQRIKLEEAKRIENERLARLKADAEAALLHLKNKLISTVVGRRYLISVGTACFVRMIIYNFRSLCQIILVEDQINLVRLFVKWTLTELCGACDDQRICSSTALVEPTKGYISYIILYLTGTESFVSNIMIPSRYTACIATFVSYLTFSALGHKVLRIFHCTSLHHAFNIMLVSVFIMGSTIGRSSLQLIFQVFLLNFAIAGSLYLGFDRQLKGHRKKDGYDDRVVLENYHAECTNAFKQVSRRIILYSMFGSVLVGVLPWIV